MYLGSRVDCGCLTAGKVMGSNGGWTDPDHTTHQVLMKLLIVSAYPLGRGEVDTLFFNYYCFLDTTQI